MPPSPTAHASSAAAAYTARSITDVPLFAFDQAEPSKCRMVPASPTAHTSFLLVPAMLASLGQGPPSPRPFTPSGRSISAHTVPSKCAMVDRSPTAHTSVAPDPQTLRKGS